MARKIINLRKIIISTLAITITILFVVSTVAYYSLCRMVMPRARDNIVKDAQSQIMSKYNVERVTFTTVDNITLLGLLIKRPVARANILLCHGYHQKKERLLQFLDLFPDYNIFMFDFRGHGESHDHLISFGFHEADDVRAAMACFKDRIAQHVPKDSSLPFVILGISMGGAAALKAMHMEPHLANGLILDAVFSDLWREVNHVFSLKSGLPRWPFLPLMLLMRPLFSAIDIFSLRPMEYIKSLQVPVLIIHSCVDPVTKPKDALMLYQAAHEAGKSAKLWITPPGRHGRLYDAHREQYVCKVSSFIRSLS